MLIQVMTIQMHGVVLLTAIILSVSLVGCRDRSINRDDLIGRFEYHSGDKAQGSTCFVLNSDGGYVPAITNHLCVVPIGSLPSLAL